MAETGVNQVRLVVVQSKDDVRFLHFFRSDRILRLHTMLSLSGSMNGWHPYLHAHPILMINKDKINSPPTYTQPSAVRILWHSAIFSLYINQFVLERLTIIGRLTVIKLLAFSKLVYLFLVFQALVYTYLNISIIFFINLFGRINQIK